MQNIWHSAHRGNKQPPAPCPFQHSGDAMTKPWPSGVPLAGSPPTVLLGFLKEFIYFVFGCAGSSLLRGLLSSCGEHGATLQLWRLGFSLQGPHLYDTGSRHSGSEAAAPGL